MFAIIWSPPCVCSACCFALHRSPPKVARCLTFPSRCLEPLATTGTYFSDWNRQTAQGFLRLPNLDHDPDRDSIRPPPQGARLRRGLGRVAGFQQHPVAATSFVVGPCCIASLRWRPARSGLGPAGFFKKLKLSRYWSPAETLPKSSEDKFH
jgi:hypothetical protein